MTASATTHDAEVIIVGGGPAGAATAWMLAREGVDVLVLERARFPRDKPCAEYVSPQASRIFAEMGVLDRIETAGAAQLAGMVVRSPAGVSFRGDFRGGHGFRGFRDRGLALRRPVLDTILLECARSAGARIFEESRVTELVRDRTGRVVGVEARRSDSDLPGGGGGGGVGVASVLRGRAVVGADGLRSVVARRLGLTRQARWPRRIAFVTHYGGVDGMGSAGEMHVERNGYLGLAQVGHGETNVALVVPARVARGVGSRQGDFLRQWIDQRPHLALRFRDAAQTSPVLATGPFAAHARAAWSPGAALVGDAADFFDPFTGEGIYAALRGAELLSPYLAEAARSATSRSSDLALAAYDRRRRDEFRGKWRVERAVGFAVGSPAIFNRVARVLSAHRDMADLLVGVTGDFVPAREVMRAGYLIRFLAPSHPPASDLRASDSAQPTSQPPAPAGAPSTTGTVSTSPPSPTPPNHLPVQVT
jgi:menaquinone-9 beta-reductase